MNPVVIICRDGANAQALDAAVPEDAEDAADAHPLVEAADAATLLFVVTPLEATFDAVVV